MGLLQNHVGSAGYATQKYPNREGIDETQQTFQVHFTSTTDYATVHNQDLNPFMWTAAASDMLKIKRARK